MKKSNLVNSTGSNYDWWRDEYEEESEKAAITETTPAIKNQINTQSENKKIVDEVKVSSCCSCGCFSVISSAIKSLFSISYFNKSEHYGTFETAVQEAKK